MTVSSITPNNINGAFPVAGQDNDSQGFRDNFVNIKNNFISAQADINSLFSNTVVLNGTSLMSNATIVNATTLNVVQTLYPVVTPAAVSGAVHLVYANGDFQQVVANGNITLSFDWTGAVAGKYAKFRVWISNLATGQTITLDPTVTIGVKGVTGNSASLVVTVPSFTIPHGDYVLEFSTINGGSTVMVQAIIVP